MSSPQGYRRTFLNFFVLWCFSSPSISGFAWTNIDAFHVAHNKPTSVATPAFVRRGRTLHSQATPHESSGTSYTTTTTTTTQQEGGPSPTTGEELAERYLLCSDEQQTSSGKSTIYKGYPKCQDTGEPIGEAVVIKVSDNTEALEREHENYKIVHDDLFVETHEYIEPIDGDADNGVSIEECDILHQGNGALVMELGAQDLKGYLEQNGPLTGQELQAVARRCVACIENLHENGMVWTEMKSENFIRQECGTIKGIDLESAGKCVHENFERE